MSFLPRFQDRPRRHPDSAYRSIGGEGGLVVLAGKSEVKVLNPVGVHVYGLLDGKHTLGEIASSVCEEYEVTLEVATHDVRDFVEELARHGMLAVEAVDSETEEIPS